MAQGRFDATPPRPRGVLATLIELLAALRSSRSPAQGSSELLDQHEKALDRVFPAGKPPGDGSAQWERELKRREADLEWQLAVRRWFQVAGLIATYVSLAAAVALTWSYLVA